MEAILNIITEYGPAVLEIVGAIYLCVRTIVGVSKTPVVNNKPDAQMMEVKKPVVSLLGKLLGIDLTQGRVEKPDAPTAMPKAPKKLPPAMPSVILLCIVVGFLATGCAETSTIMDPLGIKAFNQPANVSKIDTEGNQEAVYQGLGGTNAKVDADGVWFMTPGTGSTLAKDGVYGYFPGDLDIGSLEFSPATGTIKMKNVKMTNSKPIQAQSQMVMAGFQAIEGMTQIEAKKKIEMMVQAKEMLQITADALLKYYVPTLPTGTIPVAAPVDAPTMLDALKPGA